jgi:hypothetical protein
MAPEAFKHAYGGGGRDPTVAVRQGNMNFGGSVAQSAGQKPAQFALAPPEGRRDQSPAWHVCCSSPIYKPHNSAFEDGQNLRNPGRVRLEGSGSHPVDTVVQTQGIRGFLGAQQMALVLLLYLAFQISCCCRHHIKCRHGTMPFSAPDSWPCEKC